MKKVIAMLLLVGTLISQNSNANENPTIFKALPKTFFAQYPDATHVSIENYESATLVVFVENYRQCIALYNENGQFTGEGRYITAREMPRRVTRALEQKLGNVQIETALEFYPENDLPYYCAWVSTDKKKILLKVFASGGVEIIRKVSKM